MLFIRRQIYICSRFIKLYNRYQSTINKWLLIGENEAVVVYSAGSLTQDHKRNDRNSMPKKPSGSHRDKSESVLKVVKIAPIHSRTE
ncbi:putative uncharacterized protein [Klebsiella pneumoniae]|nr:putative uncharacterized protein [Klebsiella pneumoniae]